LTLGQPSSSTPVPASERPAKRSWQRVDGVLLLDKASGMTSNHALQAARRVFSAAKAGHTGTLDPMATGLLPLCFGEATKFSADLLDADKTYEAELLFGVTTDTADAEGSVLTRCEPTFSRADLEAALSRFQGTISQVPPMHSALKQGGQPLYKLARKGISVERQAREVTIHSLELMAFELPRCRLRVCCSKGTYVRTLAEDIGKALLCGAHLCALRRTAVGPLALAQAVSLEALTTLSEAERQAFLLAPDALLQSLPAVELDVASSARFAHGNPVAADVPPGKCRVYGDDGRLLGVGLAGVDGKLHPTRLVSA
jgi:tRNA pseudouridine55 synthase